MAASRSTHDQPIFMTWCQRSAERHASDNVSPPRQRVIHQPVPDLDYTPAPEYPSLYTPLNKDQLDMIRRVLINEDDALHAAVLLDAASYPEVVHSAQDNTEEDLEGVTTIRALRQPAYADLEAALRRINRAVDSETEPCHQRRWEGHDDGTTALRALGLQLLELGFTVADASGLDCAEVESAVSRVYGLSGQAS
ncbi:hypothetical protein ABZ639_31540 [Saccharomonospora sp. NPDC006951]